MEGKHVILSTPTGSGKSLVALGLHFKALCEGRRSLYTVADQGAREREVLLAVRRLRRRERRHADRRRHDQPRGADHLLHRRGALEHGAAPRRPRRRALRGDGRVPLLRRPRARRGLAGAAPHAAAHAVPADVGDARRHAHDRGAAAARRPSREPVHGHVASIARCRSTTSTARRRSTRPSSDLHRAGPRADLRRQLHAARARRAGAGAHQRARSPPRASARRSATHIGDFRFDTPYGKDRAPHPRPRHRHPPRRPPAQVPAAGRAARAAAACSRSSAAPTRSASASTSRSAPCSSPSSASSTAETVILKVRDFKQIAGRAGPQGLRRQGQGGVPGARARDREQAPRAARRGKGKRQDACTARRRRATASCRGTRRRSSS